LIVRRGITCERLSGWAQSGRDLTVHPRARPWRARFYRLRHREAVRQVVDSDLGWDLGGRRGVRATRPSVFARPERDDRRARGWPVVTVAVCRAIGTRRGRTASTDSRPTQKARHMKLRNSTARAISRRPLPRSRQSARRATSWMSVAAADRRNAGSERFCAWCAE